jgi:hypothetical protein
VGVPGLPTRSCGVSHEPGSARPFLLEFAEIKLAKGTVAQDVLFYYYVQCRSGQQVMEFDFLNFGAKLACHIEGGFIYLE